MCVCVLFVMYQPRFMKQIGWSLDLILICDRGRERKPYLIESTHLLLHVDRQQIKTFIFNSCFMSGCHSNNKYSELKLSFDNVILVIQQFRQQIIRNIWKDIRAEEETSPRRERETERA